MTDLLLKGKSRGASAQRRAGKAGAKAAQEDCTWQVCSLAAGTPFVT